MGFRAQAVRSYVKYFSHLASQFMAKNCINQRQRSRFSGRRDDESLTEAKNVFALKIVLR